ncbi:MAG: nuclear transport factor 2 family protein [Rhodothermales bacterium]|nr:nuclear transport factor 2 family protein [Rhodothermales bacterium]MBO6778224.1 nuclear transport factor 2 family protein [Rhodothermales bacterium]
MNATEHEVWQRELQIRAAIAQSSIPDLEDLIHQDLVFVIPSGAVLTKQADLESHRTGTISIAAADYSEDHIARVGSNFVTTTRVHLTGTWQRNPFKGDFRYIRVWARSKGGEWQVIAGSGTAIAT